MKKLLVLLFLCTGHLCQAQVFTSPWSFHSGWGNDDRIFSTTFDKDGNIYSTGEFQGIVDFDPGPGTYNLSTPPGFLQQDAFVQKLDSAGNLLWVKQFGAPIDSRQLVNHIEVDDSNNVYLLGAYFHQIQFSPNDTVWGNISLQFPRSFLVKLDSQGNVRWGMAWNSPLAADRIYLYDMTIDSIGNMFLFGFFGGTIDFDPTSNSVISRSSLGGSDDPVALRVSSSGSVKKVRVFNTTNNGYGRYLGTDKKGNIFLSGRYTGSFDFDNGPGTDIRTSYTDGENFITRVDTALDYVWVITSTIFPFRLDANELGEVFTYGAFGGTRDFDPGPGVSNLTSQGSSDIYFSKFDLGGNFQWAKNFGGLSPEGASEVVVTKSQILLMGTFKDSIDLSTGPGKIWARSNGGQDAFVLLLDSLGNYRGHASFGGTGDDEIWSGAFSEKDNVVIGGQFYNTMDIDPTLGVQNVTSAGAKDMFLVKMALCKKDHLSYADTTCGSYTLPSGSRTFTQSGTYIDTLASISGCDSILTIQATILPAINPTLTLEDYGFHCRATGSNLTYQWINCQTGLVIQNATDSIYLPVYNGQFAVR
ncbi:MAG: hypothetical protein LPK79_06070, partial [Bacteroidota bacterium]|nr:hypothetical protein [Bacteroidota bacterium]